jgi:predicted dehydrogenase
MKRGTKTKALSRREFLKGAAAAGALAAAARAIPSGALGAPGRAPAGERIVMGAIGVGGRGGYDLSILLQDKGVQFVAVCDVQQTRRDAAKNIVDRRYGNSDCVAYRDFREMLAGARGLDAVLIATGDRWHTQASILAMRAGLHVFCEKPNTMTVAEGQALVGAARRYGCVFQAGMQRLSEANFVFADELARSGRLGRLHTVRAHILPFRMRTDALPPQPQPDRESLDWDLWLGPAPWRPFNRGYLGGCGAWLDYYDFGTGVAGWGSHTFCQCQSAMDLKETSAVEYEYPGNDNAEGFTLRYANGVKLVMHIQGWRGTCGVRYEGDEGWVSVADGYSRPDVSAPALLEDYQKLVSAYTARTGRPMHHLADFLDGVRKGRTCVANEVVAHRTMTTNHAANVCMLLKRNVRWDPLAERFIGDDEANLFLSRAMRAPWRT